MSLPVHGYGGYYIVCEFTEHLSLCVTKMCSMLLNVLLHLKHCIKTKMSSLMSVGSTDSLQGSQKKASSVGFFVIVVVLQYVLPLCGQIHSRKTQTSINKSRSLNLENFCLTNFYRCTHELLLLHKSQMPL